MSLLKTRSRSSQVYAKADHFTKQPVVLADEPSFNDVLTSVLLA